jgi:hypothetical protein
LNSETTLQHSALLNVNSCPQIRALTRKGEQPRLRMANRIVPVFGTMFNYMKLFA